MNLYPLRFAPIYKYRIWGGNKFQAILGRRDVPARISACGESWEISALQGDISVVANGFLEGNSIEELAEIYMDELLGRHVFEKFGTEFPLLIKMLDTTDKLSIQVHPGDELAAKRHHAWGKTEFWHIISAEPGAEIALGFNRHVSQASFARMLEDSSLIDALNIEKPKVGDSFFIPSGRVHALMSGLLVAEIQQTSDVTYRIYDWGRTDASGQIRELHADMALGAIDFSPAPAEGYKIPLASGPLADSQYFSVNYVSIPSGSSVQKDIYALDSFVLYICVAGSAVLHGKDFPDTEMALGQVVLVPASVCIYTLGSSAGAGLLEAFIRI
jgi:mannose-6-phosphate isomerase